MGIGEALKKGIGACIGIEAARMLEAAYKTDDILERIPKSVVGGAMASIAYSMVTEKKAEEKPKYFRGWSSST